MPTATPAPVPIIPVPVPMPVPSDPRLRREFFLNLDKQHTKGAIIGTIILLGASILLFALAFYFVKIRPRNF